MKLTDAQRRYWRLNLLLTFGLLALWFGVTFVTGYYASELNAISFLGFPLGFYMGAQGALIIYALIIGFYAWYMNRLDRQFGAADDDWSA